MFNATTIDLKEAHAAFEKPNTDGDGFIDEKEFQGWRASANSRPNVAVNEKALAEFDSWYASSGMGRESLEEDMALLIEWDMSVAL
jgi:Ca2+-binding EF-hand superfamily protein